MTEETETQETTQGNESAETAKAEGTLLTQGQEGTQEEAEGLHDSTKESGEQSEGQDSPAKIEGAPEQYEDFKIPEGFSMDKEALDLFVEQAKTSNLSQESAQKLVDFHTAQLQKQAEDGKELERTTREQWKEEVANDPVLKKSENKALAVKAVDRFGSPELKELLEVSGLGDHPQLIKFCYEIGKAFKEDTIVPAGTHTNEDKKIEDVFYS